MLPAPAVPLEGLGHFGQLLEAGPLLLHATSAPLPFQYPFPLPLHFHSTSTSTLFPVPFPFPLPFPLPLPFPFPFILQFHFSTHSHPLTPPTCWGCSITLPPPPPAQPRRCAPRSQDLAPPVHTPLSRPELAFPWAAFPAEKNSPGCWGHFCMILSCGEQLAESWTEKR